MLKPEGIKLLIVGKRTFCLQIKDIISGSPFVCQSISNVIEARADLSKNHHDLLLCDLDMQEFSGQKWFKSVRELHPDLPIVAAAQSYDRKRATEVLDAGVSEFMLKSADVHTFLIHIENAFRRAELEKDLLGNRQDLLNKNAELQEFMADFDAFSYSVSHDLRAPLRHIQGFSNILLEKAAEELSEKSHRYLTIIQEAVDGLSQQLECLLSFSRAGRRELLFSEVETEKLVQQLISDLKSRTSGRKICWQISDLPPIVGDIHSIREVFLILLENAVKFSAMKENAEIKISCKPREKEVEFCVADNGVGFDQAASRRLFQVFGRLHGEDEFPGRGIGLAIAKQLIKRHQGKIWAEAVPDSGARFYFLLPRVPEGVS